MSDVVTVDAMPTTALAEQVIGFRIMRETEIAPGWWGQAVEVGETGSGSVAHQFCTEQNAVTMNLNRSKMIQYFADPIYAEQLSPADRAASAAWHAEQSAALYDEAAADARKADNETEAALCEAYAAGVRAESRRRTVALRGR